MQVPITREPTISLRGYPLNPMLRNTMPARSKVQQKAAGAALAAKRGDMPKSQLKGASKEMEKSMSEKELHDLAKTRRKSLPARKDGGEK
jgi:hypothetical protein